MRIILFLFVFFAITAVGAVACALTNSLWPLASLSAGFIGAAVVPWTLGLTIKPEDQ